MDWSVSPVCWSWLEGFRFKTCWWPQVVAPTFFFYLFRLSISLCSYRARPRFHSLPLYPCSPRSLFHLHTHAFIFWVTALVVAVLWPLNNVLILVVVVCRVVKLSVWCDWSPEIRCPHHNAQLVSRGLFSMPHQSGDAQNTRTNTQTTYSCSQSVNTHMSTYSMYIYTCRYSLKGTTRATLTRETD